MKSIPPALQGALQKPGMSTCFLVKIVRKDGSVFGFCSLDADVTLDDGYGLVTYDSAQELRPQNIQQEANFAVDNTDLLGWFNSAMQKWVMAGKLNLAEVTVYRCAYLRPEAGIEVVAFGTVGEVDFTPDANGKRKVEYRGLTQQLQANITQPWSLTCRAKFGDERCGMPLVWESGEITAVGDDPRTKFTIGGVAQPDGYFTIGVIEMLTGDNAGQEVEIESWLATGETQLGFPAAYPVKVGDTLRIRRDCDKTARMCKEYGNLVNMRAEHLTPVQDQAIMVPGAYIRSIGAK